LKIFIEAAVKFFTAAFGDDADLAADGTAIFGGVVGCEYLNFLHGSELFVQLCLLLLSSSLFTAFISGRGEASRIASGVSFSIQRETPYWSLPIAGS
jgi:hypothetical protein